MKKLKTILALILALAMCCVLFAGCGNDSAADDSAKDDSSSSTAKDDKSDDAASDDKSDDKSDDSSDDGMHEVYKLASEGAICLNGLDNPYDESRKDIPKAWPQEDLDGDDDILTIGWTEQNADNDWFVGIGAGAKAICEKYGYELNYVVCDNDVTKQSQQIDTFISLDVDIMVVDPLNQASVVEDVNRAVEANIPVLCVGTPPLECGCITTIVNNSFDSGWNAGLYLGTCFDGEDIYCGLIPGKLGNGTAETRSGMSVAGMIYQRMEDAGTPISKEDACLAAYYIMLDVSKGGKAEYADAGIYIVGYGEGDWTVDGGLRAAEDLITANAANMNLIIGDNDFEAIGALTAVENAGLEDQIKVAAAGADGTLAAVELVSEGKLLCTGTNSGAANGAFAIEFIHDIYENGFDCSDMRLMSPIKNYCINPENAGDFLNDGANGYDAAFYKTPEYESPETYPEYIARLSAAA